MRPGGETVITRLADILVIQAIRSWIDQDPAAQTLVGEPAMHYVARWRMNVAQTRLKEDDTPLGDLASRPGYQSEAAFSRAFKRFIGVSPGAVRRTGDAATAARAVAGSNPRAAWE